MTKKSCYKKPSNITLLNKMHLKFKPFQYLTAGSTKLASPSYDKKMLKNV